MKILIVLTSHGQLGDTGRETGFWLEELAAPYYSFKEAGAAITLASPLGGRPPFDPASAGPDYETDQTRRFLADQEALNQLGRTVKLPEVSPSDFDAVFYPGGHGVVWDLAEDPACIALIEGFAHTGKPVALVCHAPGVLRHVKGADGRPLVDGRNVTGFTNSEEEAIGLTEVVPFLLEDELTAKGGLFSRGPDWGSYVVRDGLLITGQNPESSRAAADALLQTLTLPAF